jgi:hypothetical protein
MYEIGYSLHSDAQIANKAENQKRGTKCPMEDF